MKSLLLPFLLLILAIQFGNAQSLPPYPGIRFQGSLTTNLGQPITGSHDVTVRIYTQSTGGLPIYAQVYSGLTINKGILDVIVNVSGLPFDSLYWAETQLDNEVFLPRTQLLSVPYSFHAFKADTSAFARAAYPVGFAGGGLSGQYPNPVIADSSLTASKFKKRTFDSIGSGLYLHITGGSMTGPITNVGNPPITMGKGNFGEGNSNPGIDAFVAGANNSARGNYSFVGGGGSSTLSDSNSASGDFSVIGGGTRNRIDNWYGTIGGGIHNQVIGSPYTTITGGVENFSSGSFAGTIGGGYENNISNSYSTVSGGYVNSASGLTSTVSGGAHNYARGQGAFVGGGGNMAQSDSNSALGSYAVVVGGIDNVAKDTSGVVGGGSHNISLKPYSTINGGLGNTCGVLNQPYGIYTTVGGGFDNSSYNDGCTVGGGESNFAGNSTLGRPGNYATVGGGTNNNAFGPSTTISGGSNNSAGSYSGMGVGGNSTIGGGSNNAAGGEGATIPGGENNSVDGGTGSTIGGGEQNSIGGGIPYGSYHTISGGYQNIAGVYSGVWACTVGGGSNDTSYGNFSTVPGGISNKALGDYSFAAGQQAKALHTGTFVWADNSNSDFVSSTSNEFDVRASGGTRIFSNAALTAGVTLAPGASAWASVSDSTMKRNARLVIGTEILDKVIDLPIKRWSYKAQDPSIEHIGPMAQDFYATFGVGDNNKTISTIDPSGVALAAIQELAKQNKLLAERVTQLESELKNLMEQKKVSVTNAVTGTK